MAAIIYLKECSSTNDEIINFLPSENNEELTLYTFSQTSGKGQYGNSWESAKNLNLAFTIAFSSDLIKIQDNLLNFHTAVLLAEFLAILTKTPVDIKWPNDIIIKNKKVSGLLIEKKNIGGISYFLIGIGLNVLQRDFVDLPKAGSIYSQTGLSCNLQDLALDLHNCLLENLPVKVAQDNLLSKLNQNLFRKNIVSVFELNSLRQNGIIRKVDKEGFLWIDLENEGLKKFYHKEIELLY